MDYKKQIFEALKAKFQGVNANVLNRIAAMLSKTVTTEEQVTTAVAGVTKEYIEVIESYGDSRATEAAQTAVTNYETQHNLKDGKPVEQQGGAAGGGGSQVQTSGGTDATTQQMLQQILEQNKKLQERIDRMDGERTTATRRQELDGIIGKLPENLRKPYERTPLDSLTDEQWNTLKGELQTEVEGLASTLNAKGAVFGKPAAQHGGSSQQGELTQEQKDAIAKRENAPKDGQPF